MKRPRLNVASTELIPLVLGGMAGAAWLLVFTTDAAFADDCLQYVKNVKNFVAIPKGLLEDCMRTGSVQAIITAAIGGVGGGVIATAVNKGLKEAAGKAGPGPHVKPDAEPKTEATEKGDLPEAPPGQASRENTPEACRTLFDKYQAALQEAHGQNQALQTVKRGYEEATGNHLKNLGRLTAALAVDAADMASAGVGGIKGGIGVAKAAAQLPDALKGTVNLINKSIARSGHLATMITGLIEDIAGLATKAARLATAADEAGRLSAKAEGRIADLVREAAAIEGRVAQYDELVRFARSADATLLERNVATKSALAAEEALKEAQQNHQKILDRKAALEDWAARERIMIESEDARNFADRHAELSADRSKIEAMRAKHAENAKAAHKDWQDKMSELSAAKKELDQARANAAHLQKHKQNVLMAEQEVRKAAIVRDEAKVHLESAEAELRAFDDADRAKFGATRDERLKAAQAAVNEARNAGESAISRKKQAEEALAKFNSQLDNQEPDFWKMSGDDLDARGALTNTIEAAEERLARAQNAADEWLAENPGQALPDNLRTEIHDADTLRGRAYNDRREFDWQMDAEGKSSPFTPEQVAEHSRLRAERDAAAAEAAPYVARVEEAQAQVNLVNTPSETEFAAGKRAGSERAELAGKVYTAKQHVDQANQVHADAEASVATAKKDMSEWDLSGTGEPLDTLQPLQTTQARYDQLLKDQEALRVKYESYASGSFGNEAEAAAIRTRMDKVEAELAAWKDPDFDVEAAKRNPEKYAQWKSEQTGLDKIGASETQISTLQTKVADLQTHLATLEKKLSEQQAQAGGRSTESLEAEANDVKTELRTKQGELDTAKKELASQQDTAERARADAKDAETKKAEAEAKKKQLEDEKRKEDEETARLQKLQDNPVAPPTDLTGVAPLLGSEWTPYHGSEAEKIAQKSRAAREKFDQALDAITPDVLTAPFRFAGRKFGEAFHWAFGGQSPDEVAAIIKRGDERVKQWKEWLINAENHAEATLKQARELKNELDACNARNQ